MKQISQGELRTENGEMIRTRGAILISVIVFATIAVTVTIGLVNWGAAVLMSIRTVQQREQIFEIAEAGVDYYRWHLAHASSDFQDGTGAAGPYVHDFLDKNGNILGTYTLTITPPPIGSTLVKISSKGKISANPNLSRTINTVLAIPSLAKFAVVANDVMNFGVGTEVFGPIHSNNGIHFDGIAHNQVTSAVTQYTDPDVSQIEWGVYTTSGANDPQPPTAVPSRPDVFMVGRQFPVPAVDFTGLAANLSQLKTLAQASSRYYGPSLAQGYYILLKNTNKFDLYKVTATESAPGGCSNTGGQAQWGTWSVKTKTLISSNNTFPSNGVIFVEDHLWIDGIINGARLTVAAGKIGNADPPNLDANITINNDLLYTNYDGSDSIGLIAQGNITVGLVSGDTMRIDAALVAQDGRVGRYLYSSSCKLGSPSVNYYARNSLTLYGMIATNKRYGFAYSGSNPTCATVSNGYCARNIIYDGNLLYGPPPSFPLSSSQYQTISWQELAQ